MYVYPTKPNEIYHYGMPRRSGRYPWGSGDRPYQSVKDALKGKRRSEYFTSERTIPKGTKMYRTTISEKPFDGNDGVYVTYLQPDRDLYKSGYIRVQNKGNKTIEHEFVTKDDLKIPSREIYKQSLNKVLDDNPDLLKESVSNFFNMQYPNQSEKRYKLMYVMGYKPGEWDELINNVILEFKDMTINEKWAELSTTLGLSTGLKNAVIKDLSSKGYNAMVDEASVGGHDTFAIEGIDPLIVFDKELLDVNKTYDVSEKQEKKSASNYLKWRSESRKNNDW